MPQPRPIRQPRGMTAFIVVWLGQMISILASRMSQFALTIWAYQMTGSATALALVQVAFITPLLLMSPFAGALVDRHNRKVMMALSDIGAGASTVLIFILYLGGGLQIWHLYIAAVISGTFESFQFPAYSASISLMVGKEQLGRANGLVSLMDAGPGVVAPLLAGALFPVIGLSGLLTFDILTFILAVGALAVVFVPQPPPTAEGAAGKGSLIHEAVFGFRYIFARPSLLGLQLTFLFGNLFSGIGYSIMAPMILARSANDPFTFGSVQTAGAVGGIVGGIIMSAWGGFKRRSFGVVAGFVWSGLMGMLILGLGQSAPIWLIGSFMGALAIPLTNGSNQAIWQAKVAPDTQGRVFSARRLIAWITNPITPLIAGPLSDFVLEPALRNGESPLASLFGGWVGIGPGAGMGLLIAFAGVASALVGFIAWTSRPIRDVDTLLPDAIPAKMSAP